MRYFAYSLVFNCLCTRFKFTLFFWFGIQVFLIAVKKNTISILSTESSKLNGITAMDYDNGKFDLLDDINIHVGQHCMKFMLMILWFNIHLDFLSTCKDLRHFTSNRSHLCPNFIGIVFSPFSTDPYPLVIYRLLIKSLVIMLIWWVWTVQFYSSPVHDRYPKYQMCICKTMRMLILN